MWQNTASLHSAFSVEKLPGAQNPGVAAGKQELLRHHSSPGTQRSPIRLGEKGPAHYSDTVNTTIGVQRQHPKCGFGHSLKAPVPKSPMLQAERRYRSGKN